MEEEDLKLILYLKKKNANFFFTIGSKNHQFQAHCLALKIKKKSTVLQVNGVDVRKKSLKDIQKLLDSVKEGDAVALVILEPNSTSSQQGTIPEPSRIFGLCEECEPDSQLKQYESANAWLLHAK